jgi:outer membrane protein, multidrug efflux system
MFRNSIQPPLSRLTVVSLYFLALLFHGCKVGPNYEEPKLELSPAYLNTSKVTGSAPMGGWRELFKSPELNALIEKAEANNLDLQAAWQSVIASRAVLRRTRADNLPEVDAGLRSNYFNNSGALSSSGVGDSGERYDADLAAFWEIDLFGRIRRSINATEASIEAQEALYQDLIFSIQADVALLYFRISSLQSEADVLERSLQTRKESYDLVKQRFEAGTVTELAVAQTASLLANAEFRFLGVQRLQNSLIYSLALLLGETPSTFQFTPRPLELDPPPVPNDLPGDLLKRRPDIRFAERSLAEANERVGVAKASFFPSITLRGTAGFASRNWDELFDSNANLDSLRPGISVPLFQGGRLKANEAQAIALYERRYFIYRKAVISAVTEVEDALQSLNLVQLQQEALFSAVESSRKAREISRVQYERGISDFISALDAERTALNAEQQYVQIKSVHFIDTIDLIRALGGSW